ncbi:MAG: hypothetical protein ACXWK9_06850 [Myxococcaceae bacterium]
MAAERTRPSAPPPGDPAAGSIRERTYREEEVAAILRRAARLEHDRPITTGALSLPEIETIARDAGIDLGMVRQAARELDEDRGGGVGAAIAGAPVRRTFERVVDGEIGAEDHERLAEEIRDVLSGPGGGFTGRTSSLGRSLTFSGFAGMSTVQVNVGPRDGRTLIRIGVDRSQLAGGLFGGIVGGVGGGLGAQVGWMLPVLLHLPVEAGLGGAALVVVASFGLARSIFARNGRGLDRALDALADRLEELAQRAIATHPPPVSGA